MFMKMVDERWGLKLSVEEVAKKIKHFLLLRHKSSQTDESDTLIPRRELQPDDNRFDFRPFLYGTKWTRQFRHIDALVAQRTKLKRFDFDSTV